ncbi:MAG: hypothetical protein [Caudoviricetes sp.]|nr:MAG: hypothetical protein [Caudoviricetes sp.]
MLELVPESSKMTEGLNRYLDQGILGLTVFALIGALIWVVRQWRQAEREKELLHEARLQDAKEMAGLSSELKTTIDTLVTSLGKRSNGRDG